MQRKPAKLFGNRMVFYTSACVFQQRVQGGSYKFNPVYLIVIADFDMKPFEKRLLNEIVFMERETNVILTEDVKIFFLSLKQVSKEWDDCKTELERMANMKLKGVPLGDIMLYTGLTEEQVQDL